MTRVAIQGREWYPVYVVLHETDDDFEGGLTMHEVDDETLARWRAAAAAFGQAQREMDLLASPRCPECGHPIIRHQEHSKEWDNWSCLAWFTDETGARTKRCRCRYGCPPGRLAELQAREAEDRAWLAEHPSGRQYVDPPGCACTDCITGYSRPAHNQAEYEDTPERWRR